MYLCHRLNKKMFHFIAIVYVCVLSKMTVFGFPVSQLGVFSFDLVQISRDTAFPTRLHERPKKTQISLCCPPEDAMDNWLPRH